MSSTLLERATRTRDDVRRRRGGHRRALLIVSGGWLTLMTGANLAAPHYHV